MGEPSQTPRFIEVIRDKARLLEGEAEILQQGGQVMDIVGDPKLPINHLLQSGIRQAFQHPVG